VTFVAGEEWGRLFRSFERSAWRLETQGIYREPNEQEHLRKFLAGEADDLDWLSEWFDNIRTIRAAGKTFGRVRVLTEPLTDYLRFELSMTPLAVQAGEDIRVLSADRAAELGLPDHDFWLFDDRIVARMEFGDQGFVRAELLTDDATVQRHLAWRETAQKHATPFTDYARATPIT
jgi:hypothetical protein